MNNKNLFSVLILLMFSASVYSKIGILVNSDFYPEIREAVLMYAKDVELIEKKSVWIDSTSFSNEWLKSEIPEQDLRDTLINHWENDSLEGVVLIGRFPVVEYIDIYFKDDDPTDVYYMDLDGNWTGRSLSEQGIAQYLNYTGDDSGNKKVDIWLTRVIPSLIVSVINKYISKNWLDSSLATTEKEIVDSYFKRVHNRMWGIDKGSKKAYTFSQDMNHNTWQYFRNSTWAKNYYTNIVYDYQPRKEVYIKRLQSDFEIVLLSNHSNASGHAMGNMSDYDMFTYSDFIKLDPLPSPRFYIASACWLSDISRPNLATFYALWGNGLISFGHSTQANINYQELVIDPLKEGKPFGEALMNWFNGDPGLKYKNFASHMVQGVGTLRLLEYPEYSEEVALVQELNSLINNKINMNYSNGLLSISKIQSNTNQPVEIKLFTLNGKSVMNLKSQLNNGKLNVSLNSGKYGSMSKGLYLCKAFIGSEEKALLINTANR